MKMVQISFFIIAGFIILFGYSCKDNPEPSKFHYRFEEKVGRGDTLEYGLDVGYPVLAACDIVKHPNEYQVSELFAAGQGLNWDSIYYRYQSKDDFTGIDSVVISNTRTDDVHDHLISISYITVVIEVE